MTEASFKHTFSCWLLKFWINWIKENNEFRIGFAVPNFRNKCTEKKLNTYINRSWKKLGTIIYVYNVNILKVTAKILIIWNNYKLHCILLMLTQLGFHKVFMEKTQFKEMRDKQKMTSLLLIYDLSVITC